jgi:sigma-70-like protein
MPPVLPFRTRSAVSPYRRARPDALNFEDLLRPQVEYLYRLAWRFTGSVADAEDLVQDVLIKLFPRTQELLEIEKLRPWLARVLYGVARWPELRDRFESRADQRRNLFRHGVHRRWPPRVNRVCRCAGAHAPRRGRRTARELSARGGFEYLDGWQQRLSADAGFAPGSALLRVGYQLELNDRRDLEQGGEFFSVSPTRHSLFASVALRNVAGWQAEARGEYRVSRYRDANRLDVTGGTIELTRKDDRFGFALRANRRLAPLWRAFVDYSYYRNESNLDTYDYSRQQLMAGIEAALEK